MNTVTIRVGRPGPAAWRWTTTTAARDLSSFRPRTPRSSLGCRLTRLRRRRRGILMAAPTKPCWGNTASSPQMKHREINIVTGFLGLSFPWGNEAFTAGKGIVTPTIAAGKGWGTRATGVNIQSTLGVAIPMADKQVIGIPINWNTSLQAHIFGKLWPEIEANYTAYKDGEHAGKEQLALTAGIIMGRFELGPRARLILGAGYQWPVSSFRIFDETWLATLRLAW